MNYQLGEPTGKTVRDMQSPSSVYGIPDAVNGRGALSFPNHYASRWIRSEPVGNANDRGWVHINSSIVNHAFYLAIEGGTNARSGKVVRGVGAANRADIENAFYQAFTYQLTRTSRMKDARHWTIEKAPNAVASTAISEAWDAVGVHGDQDVFLLWNLATGLSPRCSADSVRMVIGACNTSPRTFNVSSLYLNQHLAQENRHRAAYSMPASQFARYFGTNTIPGNSMVEGSFCWKMDQPGLHLSLEADLQGAHVSGVQTSYYAGRWQSLFNAQ